MSTDRDAGRLLAELAAAREEDRKSLATIESRIALIHDEVRRIGETATRLKLMLDNAKRIALKHGERLEAVEEKLDRTRSPGFECDH